MRRTIAKRLSEAKVRVCVCVVSTCVFCVASVCACVCMCVLWVFCVGVVVRPVGNCTLP